MHNSETQKPEQFDPETQEGEQQDFTTFFQAETGDAVADQQAIERAAVRKGPMTDAEVAVLSLKRNRYISLQDRAGIDAARERGLHIH